MFANENAILIAFSFGLATFISLAVNVYVYLKVPWWHNLKDGPIRLMVYVNTFMFVISFVVLNLLVYPKPFDFEVNMILNLPLGLVFVGFTTLHYRSQVHRTERMIPSNVPAITHHLNNVLVRIRDCWSKYETDIRISIVEPVPNGMMALLAQQNIPLEYSEFYREFRWGRGLVQGIAGECVTKQETILISNLEDTDDSYFRYWVDIGDHYGGGIICIPILEEVESFFFKRTRCLAVLSVASSEFEFLTQDHVDELRPFADEIRSILTRFNGTSPIKQHTVYAVNPMHLSETDNKPYTANQTPTSESVIGSNGGSMPDREILAAIERSSENIEELLLFDEFLELLVLKEALQNPNSDRELLMLSEASDSVIERDLQKLLEKANIPKQTKQVLDAEKAWFKQNLAKGDFETVNHYLSAAQTEVSERISSVAELPNNLNSALSDSGPSSQE